MSRTAAKFTQADVARAIRAAKQAGAADVKLRPDGTIVVSIAPDKTVLDKPGLIDEGWEIVL